MYMQAVTHSYASHIERKRSETVADKMALQRAAREAVAAADAKAKMEARAERLARPRIAARAADLSAQNADMLAVIARHGPLSYVDMFVAWELEYGTTIASATLYFRTAELMEAEHIGFTGEYTTNEDTGKSVMLFDVQANVSREQQDANREALARAKTTGTNKELRPC